MTTSDAISPGGDGLLPEDCRDIDTQAFVDAVQALCYEPYAGQDGSFSFSYSAGLFKVSWIPLGDPGTEMLTIRWHLEDGRTGEAIALLEELLKREPDHQEARSTLAITPPGLPRLARRWPHRGETAGSFASSAMARLLSLPFPSATSVAERQCPIRIISVHLL
ncbi:MAG: tetratricopeptide repeat protein, partial [Prochlorococcaceae cyanobacterium]